MVCQACSKNVPADSAFCPSCGAQVNAPAAAAKSPAENLKAAQAATAGSVTDEQPLWNGGYSAKAMYGSWLLAGLVTVGAIAVSVVFPYPPTPLVAGGLVAVMWLILFAYYLIARLDEHYTLTTQRLMHRKGILRQAMNRIEVIDIDDVKYVQGIVERMFGVGTITLMSSDTSHKSLVLKGIDDVQRVSNLIDNARREERRKRGLYMESV